MSYSIIVSILLSHEEAMYNMLSQPMFVTPASEFLRSASWFVEFLMVNTSTTNIENMVLV